MQWGRIVAIKSVEEVTPGVVQDVSPSTPPPTTTPVYPGPLAPGVNPPAGVGLPATNMRGKERFDDMLNKNRILFSTGMWGHDFNMWALSLKDDPTDPEYNQWVQWLRNNAKLKERGDKITAAPGAKKPKDELTAPPGTTAVGGLLLGEKPHMAGGNIRADMRSPFATMTDTEMLRYDKQRDKTQRIAIKASQEDVFKGRPIGADEIYDQQVEDDYLRRFMEANGIAISGDTKTLALRSGSYVYMGEEDVPQYGTHHSVFMYQDDAEFALASLPTAQLAAYQEQLGLPVTGKVDPQLASLWKQAVAGATSYAATGQKVSPKELMDLYVSATASNSRSAAAGVTYDSWDYYRAMMQVNGDISGVENGNLG